MSGEAEIREWYKVGERGTELALGLAVRSYRLLGRRLSAYVLPFIVFYFYCTSRHGRAASRRYLERLNGIGMNIPARPAPRFRHFLEFGRMILDRLSVWAGEITVRDVRCHGLELMKALVEQRQGALLLSGHLGNVEVIRALSEQVPGVVVNALMLRRQGQLFEQALRSLNQHVAARIIALEDINVDTMAQLKERVAAGEFVALLADRMAQGAPTRTQKVPFLGAPAAFPEGPWILAHLLGCPVLCLFCLRSADGSYDVYFEQLCQRVDLPSGRRQPHLAAHIAGYANRLEHYCRLAPLQWFNFYDFWSSAPGSGNSRAT